jgi:hypothetical protein
MRLEIMCGVRNPWTWVIAKPGETFIIWPQKRLIQLTVHKVLGIPEELVSIRVTKTKAISQRILYNRL